MTNEERAREAAKKVVDFPLLEAVESIILTALNAATAELEEERGRLRKEPAFVCGAIIAPNGSLRFIDVISDERYAWDYAYGFPDDEEIARCKEEGFRYQLMHAFTCDPRSALAKKDPSDA